MEINVKEQNKNLFTVEVKLTQEDIDKDIQETLRYYQKNANIPGFRKGKVPLGVVKRSLGGDDELKKGAKESVIAKAEDKIATNYRAITELKLDEESQDGMVRVYSFEAVPKIEVPKIDELTVDHKKTKFDKEQIINETLEKYREELAMLKPIEGRDEVKNGDIVELEIIKNNGEKLYDRFEVTEKSQYRFVKDVLGKKINDEFEFEEDGETRKARITSILEKVLPELNDEFVKQIDENVENLEEFKKQLEESIDAYIKNIEDSAINNEIIEKVIKETKIKVSDESLNRLATKELQRIKNEKNKVENGYEKYLKESKQTEEELLKKIKEDILNYWKENLVIENIAGLFNLKVNVQEIVNTIISMYPYMAKDRRKLENNIKKDPSLYSEIADTILKNKIAIKLRDKVKVNIIEDNGEEKEDGENKTEEA